MLLLSGFFGAVLGASLTLFFNMWKFHRDERSSRCDELCKAIVEASQSASAYWVLDYSKLPVEQLVAEAKLFASQAVIDGTFSDFRPFLDLTDQIALDARFSELLDLLTGGDFSVPGRPCDVTRATRILPVAADMTVSIRRAYRKTTPFHELNLAYHKNRARELDMPLGWR